VNGFEFDYDTFPWELIPKDMPVIGDMSSNIATKPWVPKKILDQLVVQ
jgi:hypothetical protein